MPAKKLFVAIAVFGLLAGCTHYHGPNTATPIGPITEFQSSNAVSIIIVQDPTREAVFSRYMEDKYVGNLGEWTESAMSITKRELARRGLQTMENAPKKLDMSIEYAKGELNMFMKRFRTKLQVKTGDGYHGDYFGEYSRPLFATAFEIYHAADNAVADSVTKMLSDAEIVDYLGK